jgi:hypothetical protein
MSATGSRISQITTRTAAGTVPGAASARTTSVTA